jgi:hypothetical protein
MHRTMIFLGLLLLSVGGAACAATEREPGDEQSSNLVDRDRERDARGLTLYFHGTAGKGAFTAPEVVGPRWSSLADAIGAARIALAGRSPTAIAGYSLGRQPLMRFLAEVEARSVERILLIDPLYDDGLSQAITSFRSGRGGSAPALQVLLVCSDDARSVATCASFERDLGLQACAFGGDHLGVSAVIPDILRWAGGPCPAGTTGGLSAPPVLPPPAPPPSVAPVPTSPRPRLCPPWIHPRKCPYADG